MKRIIYLIITFPFLGLLILGCSVDMLPHFASMFSISIFSHLVRNYTALNFSKGKQDKLPKYILDLNAKIQNLKDLYHDNKKEDHFLEQNDYVCLAQNIVLSVNLEQYFQDRQDLLISLRYSKEDILLVENVICLLRNSLGILTLSTQISNELLRVLIDIGKYIRECIALCSFALILDNSYIPSKSHIDKLDLIINNIALKSDSLNKIIRSLLNNALMKDSELDDNLIDVRLETIKKILMPIISKEGFVYKMVYVDSGSLKNLKDKLLKNLKNYYIKTKY